MKKIIPVLLCVLFSTITSPVYAARKPSPVPTPTPVQTSVCIDAGHDGTYTGTTYIDPVSGEILYRESDINLDVAFKLKTLLEAEPYKYPVFMTRTEYVGPEIDNRARYTLCNNEGAAILVSIHHNGSTDPTINYTKSLYKKEADIPLARMVSESVSTTLGLENRGISLFTSGVLLKSDMPATISEAFFLTNENVVSMIEGEDLSGETALDKEARGLLNAINSYFSTVR